MNADEELTVLIPYPVPGPDHAALLASYELLLRRASECLPVRIPGSPGEPFFEDWEVTRAAFVARMASTVRHLGYLAPSYSRLDGVALARTLLEHTITFAWISAKPAARLPRFLRSDRSRMLDLDKRKHGEGLLNEPLRAKYRAYVREHTQDAPGIPNQAKEADSDWLGRAREAMPAPIQLPALVEMYEIVYISFANLDHPSSTALQVFVHIEPGRPAVSVDGRPERDLQMDLRPYWLGLWSFTWALTVASLATETPRLSDLQETISQARALREYDRHGLLQINQDGETTRIALAPDADERIEQIAEARKQEHRGDP